MDPGSVRARIRRPGWTRRPTDSDLAYGGPLFNRASTFLRSRAAGRPTSDVDPAEAAPAARHGGWWADLTGMAALIRLTAFLPVEDVRLTDSAAGGAIRDALAGRTLGVPRNRLCAAVVPVPVEVPERPSGKRHQALRTALTAAAKAGLQVRSVADPAERRVIAADAARRVPRLADWARTAPDHEEHVWWVAEAADGVAAGIATAAVDAEWASLVTLVGLPGAGTESHARFLLHHTVVRSLSQAGVGRLTVLDHSPLLLAPGPQHLQRVLGYRIARLRRPVPAPAPRPGRPVPAPVTQPMGVRSAGREMGRV